MQQIYFHRVTWLILFPSSKHPSVKKHFNVAILLSYHLPIVAAAIPGEVPLPKEMLVGLCQKQNPRLNRCSLKSVSWDEVVQQQSQPSSTVFMHLTA